MRWTFRCLQSFFILFFISFAACSGGKDGASPAGSLRLPGNGDGTLGVVTKNYFRKDSPSQVSIVSVNNLGFANRFVFNSPSTLKDLGSLTADQFHVSLDGKFVTVVGQPQVFETQNVAIDALAQAGTTVLAPTLDTLCVAGPLGQGRSLGSTSFKELHITRLSTGYQYVAIGQDQPMVLGNSVGYAVREDSATKIKYSKSGYGDLTIDLSTPSDTGYFSAKLVTQVTTEWSSVDNLICHSNFSPIPQQDIPNPLVSSSATNAFDGFVSNSISWLATDPAKEKDGAFAFTSMSSAGNETTYLILTGYFSTPNYQLPAGASIDGVSAKCFWKYAACDALNPPYHEGAQLWKSTDGFNGGPLSLNTRGDAFALPAVADFSSPMGSNTDKWGATLTPAVINGSDFGIGLRFAAGTCFGVGGEVHVDSCQMTVYWH